MSAAHTKTTERAPNGWPFPKGADSITRALVEGYAPINPEFEAEISAALSDLKAANDEKDRVIAELNKANNRVNAAKGSYCLVVKRLNEWRAALVKVSHD